MAKLFLPIFLLFPLHSSAATTSEVARKAFSEPRTEHASGPLWVWNDALTDEQIRGTLQDLAGQHVKQAFVHPRPGLMTPYLSDEWFRLWQVALEEAARLDMNLWIYDENSYPSGFAGGFVPEVMPESRGRGLVLRTVTEPPAWDQTFVAVYSLKGGAWENVTAGARAGQTLVGQKFLTAKVTRASNSPWHGGRCYVDLLYPGVTEKFLEITLEPYRKRFGAEFGKRIPGVFTDEPELQPAPGLPWTEDLPARFKERWGYELTDHLASLVEEVGDWKRVRHNYLQLLSDLFIDRWAKPYFEYCEKNKLEFTGHYWEHEWPGCLRVPDNMAMYAWHQRPAIDILMNQYNEGPNAQFGNVRAVKELSSAANQLGRARTLCEAYGAGGWDLRFEDMKRIGDWMFALGVNTLDEHLSYITLRGARKRDHPQSFSYHEPWWDSYHVLADYFSRLTAAITAGEQINPVLLLEPTTTVWMYQTAGQNDPRMREIGNQFQVLVTDLERGQIEFDLGSEDILRRNGSVEGGLLKVGKRSYGTVVLAPSTENIEPTTAAFLEKFIQGGGRMIGCDSKLERIGGQASPKAAELVKHPKAVQAKAEELAGLLRSVDSNFRITAGTPAGILYHHRRRLEDGDLLFLVNTSAEAAAVGTVEAQGGGIEQWDLMSGKVRPLWFERNGGKVRTEFELPPVGSLLMFIGKGEMAAGSKPAPSGAGAPAASVTVKRLDPNVLVLDCVDLTVGGETATNLYYYAAGQRAFQKNGMARNPWDSAVQFKDEFITKKFPEESGFEVTYRFQIEEAAPAALHAVVERPDLYQITCNGKPVAAKSNEWWLDKAFGKLDLSGACQLGENALKLTAKPFTVFHEIEPVYILGAFRLQSKTNGWAIRPDQALALGPWNEQGHPFYSGKVEYLHTFQVPDPAVNRRFRLDGWRGSVAQVEVNGKSAGHLVSPPYGCELSGLLRPGENQIRVTVCGTLKNLLGPHHGNPGLGSAWPGMFQKSPEQRPPPGEKYHTVGYGLFKPAILEKY